MRVPKPGVVDLVQSLLYTWAKYWRYIWAFALAYRVNDYLRDRGAGVVFSAIASVVVYCVLRWVFDRKWFDNIFIEWVTDHTTPVDKDEV